MPWEVRSLYRFEIGFLGAWIVVPSLCLRLSIRFVFGIRTGRGESVAEMGVERDVLLPELARFFFLWIYVLWSYVLLPEREGERERDIIIIICIIILWSYVFRNWHVFFLYFYEILRFLVSFNLVFYLPSMNLRFLVWFNLVYYLPLTLNCTSFCKRWHIWCMITIFYYTITNSSQTTIK